VPLGLLETPAAFSTHQLDGQSLQGWPDAGLLYLCAFVLPLVYPCLSSLCGCTAAFCSLCAAQAIKSIQKNGLDAMAREAGIDLWKLPFEDARPERKQYLEENKGKVPVVSRSIFC
jgi:hypothetical protein